MKSIGDFLRRFQSLTPPNDAVKGAIAVAVHEGAGIMISKKDVQIAHGVAFIAGSSIVKSVIAMNRGKVLTALYEILPRSRDFVRDVR